MTALRAFPLRIAPRPGESLDSWLEATAVRLRVTMAELYEAMGFAGPHSELWRHIVLRPADTELAAISATTGLTPGQVRAMTLSRYAGIAVGIDSDTGRFAPTTPWGRVHGSRFCPHCLRATGGAWKLHWRLIWTFACLEHCCLLADFCPDCGGAQRYRYRIGAEPPRLGRCDNPAALETTARRRLRCGAALAQATVTRLAPDHPALSAQTAIADVIDSGRGDSASTSVTRFRPLMSLLTCGHWRRASCQGSVNAKSAASCPPT